MHRRFDIRWSWARFDELSLHDLYDALQLRARVFVLEQGPYLDPDGVDQHSWHLLGRLGQGLGGVLVGEGVERCVNQFPSQGIRISAQAHLAAFYGGFGFETVGEPYGEDSIPHVQMFRPA